MARIAYILLSHKDPDGIIAQAERLTQATPERETRESPNDDTITRNTPTRGAKAARRDQRP